MPTPELPDGEVRWPTLAVVGLVIAVLTVLAALVAVGIAVFVVDGTG